MPISEQQHQELLPPALLAKLERLSLTSRRPMHGQILGARRSTRHGASVEFSDYRDYVAGDDLRTVDWKAYGRLEKLFVKLFREEDDLSLHLLLDASASMAIGAPVSKLRCGQQVCAALGTIALIEFDRCSLATLSGGRIGPAPSLRGRTAVGRLIRRLQSVQPSGVATIAPALHAYAQNRTSPGVLVLVSDFYNHDLTPALLRRTSQRFDVVLAHICALEEIDPSIDAEISGDLRFVDSETGEFIELSVSPALLDEYRQAFAHFSGELEQTARAAGAAYVRISTDTPLEEIILGAMRRQRVLGGGR